ncbi:MAG: hypothetical protein PHX91_04880 [Prevotella sp.]|nr:hypothetical protein [Prevotella sp.]
MKKIILFLAAIASIMMVTSCSKDEWSNDNSEMENVFYYGFQDWGKNKNDVKFNVTQGQTIAIPVQFFSEQVRDYDVQVYYFTTSKLTLGTDYVIVDSTGNTIPASDNGGWLMVWPKAKKGLQNVYVKALNGTKGTITLQTFDPNSTVPISFDYTTITKTEDYEVRAFTQNYFVTITIK